MRNIIVVDRPKKISLDLENAEIISSKDYLSNPDYAKTTHLRIYNLCKSYRYQSTGYYVSLLAQARQHKILPNITTLQDIQSRHMLSFYQDKLDTLIQKSLKKIKSEHFILSVYFGQNVAKQHQKLSKEIFNLLRTPLLKVKLIRQQDHWILNQITTLSLEEIPENHLEYLQNFAQQYFSKKRHRHAKKNHAIYDLAILVNPEEQEPPSDPKAIEQFIRAGESLGFDVDLITKKDFNRLPEYDALFIRETTAVNHYTYQFARRAAAENLVVIDDPESIIKCTNKVYLAELFKKHHIPAPKTLIICKNNQQTIASQLGFPCVLKKPDGAFSKDVIKIDHEEQLHKELRQYFKTSEFMIAQEFIPTEYDWRIGILDRQPLFASKYFMAKNHWQIYDWNNPNTSGDYQTVELSEVPKVILKTALKAADLIGSGFYGVDLKEIKNHVYVIEINDNPNADFGVEDNILKEKLYLEIMQSFLSRIQQLKSTIS